MVKFTPKKLNPDSLGDLLRRARSEKGLTYDEAARRLNIRKEYLAAIEADNYSLLPAGLYSKNFVKKYALYLGVDSRTIKLSLNSWDAETGKNDPFSQKILKRINFLVFPKIFRNILIGGAVLSCFLYLTFYFKKIVTPPSLSLLQPNRNLMVKDSSILVTGKTENEAEIRINGELILNNNNGEFSQLIKLKKGVNTLEVSAKKKYSRENVINRQILVE